MKMATNLSINSHQHKQRKQKHNTVLIIKIKSNNRTGIHKMALMEAMLKFGQLTTELTDPVQ